MFLTRLKLWKNCNRGNVLVLFSLLLLPTIGMIGLSIDYGNRSTYKTRLDAASDAAVLAAIEVTSSELLAGTPLATAIADGNAKGASQFGANIGALSSYLAASASPSVSVSGQTVTGTLTYTAAVPTSLGNIFGYASFPVAGAANATVGLPSYLSFYLLLDVSGSMGIPSTDSGQTRLASINPDFRNLYPGGCTLACHFTSYAACQNSSGQTVNCQGYNLSRTNGTTNPPVTNCPQPDTSTCIQLRVDAVAYAVQQLLQTAQTTATMPSQFSVGLYPFIRWMQAYQPLTTNLTAVSNAAATLTSLLDNGNGSSALGSGGTHFENALTDVNNAILTVGNGSSLALPKPFVFLVTDGAQDNQYQINNGSWYGSNSATTLDESYCSTLKSRGITVSVLYVPYVPIQNPTTIWNNEDGYANANIPFIPGHLQACASPGFFFTANTPSDITNAMQAMFAQSVQSARLSR